jgi:hypothetical protein
VAHVEIKGCCKSETFKLLRYRAYFGDWKGGLINLLFTSQKSLRKHGVIFLGTVNDGDAHSK